MSTPQSVIYICTGVRINSRYDHTIYFLNGDAQQEYFAGKVVKTLSAYSYLRKTWSLKVEATMEQAKSWSYLFFHNTDSGKIYYYFINTVEYINDHTVELGLEMDVLQTYMFDFDFLPCFVEREHVEVDEIGRHTLDEGLELGELVVNGKLKMGAGDMCIMVMSTINPGTDSASLAEPALPYSYNGVFSGVKIWAIDAADWVAWGTQLQTLIDIGQSEAIVAMWMYPKSMVKLGGGDSWASDNLVHVVERAVGHSDGFASVITSRPVRVDGYTPKNKKLLTYPYQFISVTNNQGNAAVYRYERFEAGYEFALSGSLSPDGGIRITPRYYNGAEYNYEEGLSLTGFPTCAWNSDIYKLWLAQNQNTQGMNMATGGLKIAGGLIGAIATSFTGVGAAAGLGTAASGAMDIFNSLAQKADKDLIPPQAKGNFSTSVNVTNDEHCFTAYQKSVSFEMARIIDDYFTMYGYKVNRVKRPQPFLRGGFNYVKTKGCHIKGDLCNEDILKIESIFDKGITYWKDGDTIGDYSIDNSPGVG